MTLPQLKAACQEAGLSIYGNKAELIARLQDNAAKQLAEVTTPEVQMGAGDGDGLAIPEDVDAANTMATMQAGAVKMADATPTRIIQPTLTELQHLATRPTVAVDQVKQLVNDINSKYGMVMKASYNPHHETYEFDGGLQGKWCTTVHQPPEQILNRDGIKGAADQYAKVSREAGFHARSVQGATGLVGGGIN